MAETEDEADEWISVLNNSKKYALEAVFDDNTSPNDIPNKGLQELTQSILREVRGLGGNDMCCDCSAPGLFLFSFMLSISYHYCIVLEGSKAFDTINHTVL